MSELLHGIHPFTPISHFCVRVLIEAYWRLKNIYLCFGFDKMFARCNMANGYALLHSSQSNIMSHCSHVDLVTSYSMIKLLLYIFHVIAWLSLYLTNLTSMDKCSLLQEKKIYPTLSVTHLFNVDLQVL
jgi:hypothetical protein